MHDLSYTQDGMFTQFIPNTPAGESAWRTMHEKNATAVLNIHAKAVLKQLRDAGYTVAKAKPVKLSHNDINAMLAELGV